ncbi:hypothetical protein ACF0H5_010378 [Mactra antiquata]
MTPPFLHQQLLENIQFSNNKTKISTRQHDQLKSIVILLYMFDKKRTNENLVPRKKIPISDLLFEIHKSIQGYFDLFYAPFQQLKSYEVDSLPNHHFWNAQY